MKKIYYSVIVAILSFSASKAQNPSLTWAKQLGGTLIQEGYSIATDASGNVITTGYFEGTTDFDPGAGVSNLTPPGGTYDVFISKLDASGNFVWAKQVGGANYDIGYGITTDASGNIYITGSFQGTADFDPSAAVVNLTSNGSDDIFVLKLDASGNFVWAKAMGGTMGDYGNSISVDGAGAVYTTGYFYGTSDFDPSASTFNIASGGNSDIFISKLDASGNFSWAKSFVGTGIDQGRDIKFDASGNVYTTGFFSNTVDFDPSAAVVNLTAGAGSSDIFVSKLDLLGNFVWAKKMGGGSNDSGEGIFIDPSGNVLTTGSFCGVANFDPNATFNLITGANRNTFISKLNSSGVFIWAKGFISSNTGEGRSISSDASGNVYSCGHFNGGVVDFDPNASTYTMNVVGYWDAYISKLDVLGNFLWAVQLGGVSGEYGYDLAMDGSGNVHTTGVFDGTVDFDPQAAVFNIASIAGSQDSYIHKMANCSGAPSQPSVISGSITICSGNTPSYSVAAVAGATSYTWSLPGGWTGSSSTNIINTTASATSGNITISASNACGTSIVQTLSVTVNTIPATPGAISGNITICSGSSNTYSIAAVAGATAYTWVKPGGWTGSSSTNIINTTASATSGNITVSATNMCGTSAIQTLSVTINTAPSAPGSISGLTSMCVGAGATNYSVAAVAGATSYTWSLPGGWSGTSATNIISATPGTSGIFTITASNSCGMSAQQTLSVTVNSVPVANASTTQTLTCTNTTVTLNGSGVTTYTWSGPGIVSGGNSATPIVNAAGTYSLVGSTSGFTSNTATVTLTSNTIAPTVSITASNNTVCAGTSLTLTASGANTYSWSVASTATSIVVSPTTTTNYILTGTNSANGCSGNTNKSITVNPLPTVSANTSNSIICGPPFQGAATITASGASTYTWNTTATTTVIAVSPSVTTSYTVTGTDANGCVNSSVFTQSVSTCTGLSSLVSEKAEINIYPNPFSNKITIVSNGENQTVQIFNVLGSLVFNTTIETEKIEINLNEQSSGIYFVRIGSVTKKIIKE